MMKLNKLEKAILVVMTARNLDNTNALKLQVTDLVVSRRDNTGAGFFTYFRPTHREKVIKNRPIGNIFAKIEGLNNPMTFILFFEHGDIKMLEGAATLEDTTLIDFSNVCFDILQD
jgi:hypothetical protein